MTNKEAREIIVELHDSDKYSIADITEAKRMAIKALEQEPKTGHWIHHKEKCLIVLNIGNVRIVTGL